jgi:short-subunit dehydrogenase
VIPSMIERRSGRFAGIASIAGLRGLPTSSVYSATKAAMQAFLEASRVELIQYGVGVTTVNPGFVITPMTEKNRFKMPFLMTADEAARVIADGFERGARVIEFPRPMSLLMRFARFLPAPIWDRATGGYAKRKVDTGKARR